MSHAIDLSTKVRLTERAARAQRSWAEAGLDRRLAALAEAGDRLRSRRAELQEGLLADGLSHALADYYGDWVVHHSREEVLRRHASALVRWEETPHGVELLVRRPDGVVLVVTPANSPTINAAALFPALLPGNALVVRAPANDGGLRFVVEDILQATLQRHGFSLDLVQVVTSRSRAFLDAHLPEPETRTVVFFGNSTAGRSVAERCHAEDKKAVLELEGSDHMVVWKDADLTGAIASAQRAFDFSTQPCPIPKHILVHEAAFESFLAGFVERLPQVSRTVEADPASGMLVPVLRMDDYEAALAELEGVGSLRAGGFRIRADGTRDPAGPYAAPTVVALDAADIDRRPLAVMQQEIGYPLVPVICFRGDDAEIHDQMVNVLRDSEFGLRASVWSSDPEVLGRFALRVEHVGALFFNEDHAQCPYVIAPWGGPRRSGGPHGENHLFSEKTSHLQGISLKGLRREQRSFVVDALGVRGLLQDAGHLPVRDSKPEPTRSIRSAGPRSEIFDGVRIERDGPVAQLVLHRPQRHNAVDMIMKRSLEAAASRLGDIREELRCVIIRGSGRSFCSGADLEALVTFDAEEARRFMVETTWAFRRLSKLDIPVVAAVQGYCLGGGAELALHADYIIARDDAVFGFPEAKLGLVTTTGTVDRLTRAIGVNRARDLLLTGRRVDAREAYALGLVAEVVPAEAFDSAIRRRSDAFAAQPREGLSAMKGLLARDVERDATVSWIEEVETFEALVRGRKTQ